MHLFATSSLIASLVASLILTKRPLETEMSIWSTIASSSFVRLALLIKLYHGTDLYSLLIMCDWSRDEEPPLQAPPLSFKD